MTSKDFAAAREAIANSTLTSSIYIGCDSQRYSKGNGKYEARYCAVIVLHKDSCNGARIFYERRTEPDYGRKTENLAVRLMKEAEFAIEALESVIDVIGDRHLEIHLDINTNDKHASSVALNSAIGYVKGVTGYDPMVKPDSWAAMHCADHMVRHFH